MVAIINGAVTGKGNSGKTTILETIIAGAKGKPVATTREHTPDGWNTKQFYIKRPNNQSIEVFGNAHGIKSGWFSWPIDFDPCWLEKCTGIAEKP